MARIARFAIACLTVVTFVASTRSAPEKPVAPAEKQIRDLNLITGSDPATRALKSLLDDKEKAKAVIAQSLPLAKEKGKLHYNASLVLALAAADMKDLASSEIFFRNCIEQAAKLQSATKLGQSFVGLIEIYFDNKKYDETTKLCQELINMKIDDGKERIVLFAYTKSNGETDFYENDSFNTTEPLLPFIFRQQVQAMAKQGKIEQAHKVLDNLIKQVDDWRDRQLKGWLYREAGEFDKAVTSYNELIDSLKNDRKLSPEQKKLGIEKTLYILSNVYVDLKQIDKSAEVLQELLKNNPNDPGYNNDLGYIWADHDMNLDEAEKLIRKALDEDKKRRKQDPDNVDDDGKANGAYLDSLGWVLYKKKDLKGAKKVLIEALEDKNSQHIEIYDHLGDVLQALGERDGAVEAWRKGLENVTDSRRDQERKKLVEAKLKQNSK